MSGARIALLVVGLALQSACDPTALAVVVEIPERYHAPDDDARVLEYTVSVYAPGAAATVGQRCDDLRFGALDRDALASSLVLSAPLEDGALGEIPRDGKKLVVVDGIHADAGRVLTGCTDVEPFDDERETREVTVRLAPLAALEVRGATTLGARVPFDGPATITPELSVITTDGFGDPVDAVVRVTVRAIDDEVLDSADVTTDATTGVAVPVPTISRAGPFVVTFAAELPRDEVPIERRGFAAPRDTLYDEDPWGEPMALSLPLAMGDRGVVFVGVTRDLVGELRFLEPRPADGLPAFDPPTTPTGMPIGTPQPLGVLVDDTGEGFAILQMSTGAIARSTTTTAALAFGALVEVGEIGGTVQRFADVTLSVLLPIGLCARGDHASPALAVVAPRGIDPREGDHLTVYLDPMASTLGVPEGLADLLPERSLCVADDEGALHRILIVRQGSAFGVIDLGPGLDPAVPFDATTIRSEVAYTGAAIGVGVTRTAAPRLLVAALAGFNVVVEELAVTASGDAVLGPSTPLYTLPGAPRFLSSAAFTHPDARDDVHVLQYSADDVESPAVLFVASGDLASDDVFTGGINLDPCLPARACVTVMRDLDGDGVDEVFVGRDPRLARQLAPDAPSVQVIRMRW